MKKKGWSEEWKIPDSEVWKIRKWENQVKKGEKADERRCFNRRQGWSSRSQHRNAQKRRQWLHGSAQQRRSSGTYVGRKVLTYNNLKNNRHKNNKRKDNRQKNQRRFLHRLHQVGEVKDSMRKRMSLWRKKGDSDRWKRAEREVWKNTKVTKPSKERWESGRTQVLQKKGKLKKQKAAPKRAETTTMPALKCATEKKFRHLCSTKSNDV